MIGASIDYAWVVINFRGQQGWLAAYLVDISGDLRSVPVVPAPPTPTPAITATPTPSPSADLIIVSATSPNPIIPNQNFTVNVTVGNIGGSPAGSFTVAGTFPPNNIFLVAYGRVSCRAKRRRLDVRHPDRHGHVHRLP